MQIQNKIAKFRKVSEEKYIHLRLNEIDKKGVEELTSIWEDIKLPLRATSGSAGHDFYSPDDYVLMPGSEITIYTGVRAEFFDPTWALFIFPRSGMSFKTGVKIVNTVGVVDSDYFHSENEGQIIVKLSLPKFFNGTPNKPLEIKKGDRFCQGIFLPYGITIDDHESEKQIRNGGFGSTSK